MFCRKCGKQLGADMAFCPCCGNAVAGQLKENTGSYFSQAPGLIDTKMSADSPLQVHKAAFGQQTVQKKAPSEKSGRNIRILAGIAIGLAAVVLVVSAFLLFPRGDDKRSGNGVNVPADTTLQKSVQSTETTVLKKTFSKTEVAAIYQEYFWTEYSQTDLTCLADVTHDGIDDLIVVHFEDEDGVLIIGYVYTINAEGSVYQIYSRVGSSFHMGYGSFFNWFIKPDGAYYNLGAQEGDMAMNHGTLTFHEFYLDNQGGIIDIASKTISSEDYPELLSSLESEAFQEAYDEYDAYCQSALKSFDILYDALRSGGGDMREFSMDPQTAFIVN